MSQFDPSPAMGVASGADGFGSCETVGFVDDEEEKPMVPKVAWYCIAFALVAGLCAYSSGYVTNPALAADPRLQPGYSLPTAAATGHVSTSKITVAQIRAERKRLALISHKMKARQLKMKSELSNMKSKASDLETRETEVEDKLEEANRKLKKSRALTHSLLSSSSAKANMAQCKLKVKQLHAEMKKQRTDFNREKLSVNSAKDALSKQKEAAIEREESKETDAIKANLKEQQAGITKRLKLVDQREAELGEREKAVDLRNIQIATMRKNAFKFRKFYQLKLKKLKNARMVSLEEVERLLGKEPMELMQNEALIMPAKSIAAMSWKDVEVTDEDLPGSTNKKDPYYITKNLMKVDSKYKTGGCDKAWCDSRAKYFHITAGKSWGKAAPRVKRGWFVHKCSKPSKQDNRQCLDVDLPSTVDIPSAAAANTANPDHIAKPRCDRSWCSHHQTKHNIVHGKTWGTAPPKVKLRWFKHRHCAYPSKQNNLGCAKESAARADANGPQVIKANAQCDSDWCNEVRTDYSVEPGKSWGTAGKVLQKGWFTHKCSAPKEQNLSGCDGMDEVKKFLSGGLKATSYSTAKDYDGNSGAMGGSAGTDDPEDDDNYVADADPEDNVAAADEKAAAAKNKQIYKFLHGGLAATKFGGTAVDDDDDDDDRR